MKSSHANLQNDVNIKLQIPQLNDATMYEPTFKCPQVLFILVFIYAKHFLIFFFILFFHHYFSLPSQRPNIMFVVSKRMMMNFHLICFMFFNLFLIKPPLLLLFPRRCLFASPSSSPYSFSVHFFLIKQIMAQFNESRR